MSYIDDWLDYINYKYDVRGAYQILGGSEGLVKLIHQKQLSDLEAQRRTDAYNAGMNQEITNSQTALKQLQARHKSDLLTERFLGARSGYLAKPNLILTDEGGIYSFSDISNVLKDPAHNDFEPLKTIEGSEPISFKLKKKLTQGLKPVHKSFIFGEKNKEFDADYPNFPKTLDEQLDAKITDAYIYNNIPELNKLLGVDFISDIDQIERYVTSSMVKSSSLLDEIRMDIVEKYTNTWFEEAAEFYPTRIQKLVSKARRGDTKGQNLGAILTNSFNFYDKSMINLIQEKTKHGWRDLRGETDRVNMDDEAEIHNLFRFPGNITPPPQPKPRKLIKKNNFCCCSTTSW